MYEFCTGLCCLSLFISISIHPLNWKKLTSTTCKGFACDLWKPASWAWDNSQSSQLNCLLISNDFWLLLTKPSVQSNLGNLSEVLVCFFFFRHKIRQTNVIKVKKLIIQKSTHEEWKQSLIREFWCKQSQGGGESKFQFFLSALPV